MESMRDRQQLGSDAARCKMGRDRRDGVAVAGDDGVVRRVHRRDSDVPGFADRCGDRAFIRENGRHRAMAGQGLHQAPALGDQRHPIIECVDSRTIGGGEFTDAVAQHRVGNDAPRPQQLYQGGLHGEQGRLGVCGFMDRIGAVILCEQHIQQRPVQPIAQQRGAAVNHPPEHRLIAVEFGSHAGVLGALSGKQEGEPPRSARRLPIIRSAPLQLCGERRPQRRDASGDGRKTMREMVSPAA